MNSPLHQQAVSDQCESTPSRSDDVIRLVQLTDCHLGDTKDFVLSGVNTYHSFSHVLSDACSKHSPTLVAVTGDIACEGERKSYELFAARMAASEVNYAWLPGNHDDFLLMQSVMPQPFVRYNLLGNWIAISLISAVPGSVRGELAEQEFQQLNDLLGRHQDHFVLLFVHHPPVDIHSKWLDVQQISNNRRLADVLAKYPHVKAIFTGHVHQSGFTDWSGIPVYSTPSTCFQFTSHSDVFSVSGLPPGYRWIDLLPNGDLQTAIEHVDCDGINVDTRCIGY
jgi:Icc protein